MDSPRGLSNPTEKHEPAPAASGLKPLLLPTEKKTEPTLCPVAPTHSSEDVSHPHLWFLNGGAKTIRQVRDILQAILREARLPEDSLGPIRLIPLGGSGTSKQHLYRVVMLPSLVEAIAHSPLGKASFMKGTPSYYLPISSQMKCKKEDYTHTLSVFKIPKTADPARVKYMMECEIQALRRFGFVAPKRVTEFSTEQDLIELRFACRDVQEPVTAREVAWARLALHGLDLKPYAEAKDTTILQLHYSDEMNH